MHFCFPQISSTMAGQVSLLIETAEHTTDVLGVAHDERAVQEQENEFQSSSSKK